MAFAVFRELGSSDFFIKVSVGLGASQKGFQTVFLIRAKIFGFCSILKSLAGQTFHSDGRPRLCGGMGLNPEK